MTRCPIWTRLIKSRPGRHHLTSQPPSPLRLSSPLSIWSGRQTRRAGRIVARPPSCSVGRGIRASADLGGFSLGSLWGLSGFSRVVRPWPTSAGFLPWFFHHTGYLMFACPTSTSIDPNHLQDSRLSLLIVPVSPFALRSVSLCSFRSGTSCPSVLAYCRGTYACIVQQHGQIFLIPGTSSVFHIVQHMS